MICAAEKILLPICPPGVLLVVEPRDDGRPVRPALPLRLRPHSLVQTGDRRVPVVVGAWGRTAGENLS